MGWHVAGSIAGVWEMSFDDAAKVATMIGAAGKVADVLMWGWRQVRRVPLSARVWWCGFSIQVGAETTMPDGKGVVP